MIRALAGPGRASARTPSCGSSEARARLRAAGVELIDFGMGEPREETPAFIREALVDAITPLAPYPSAPGCRSCARRSRAGSARRFGVALDPDTEVDPDARLQGGGLRARARVRRRPGRRPAARVPGLRARRACSPASEVRRAAAARGERLAAGPRRAVDWDRAWRCCGSTTRTTRPARPRRSSSTRRAAALAREHGFVLASDEAYSELYFGAEPPVSALQVARPHERRGVQHALQALVDARLPLRLRRRRPGDRRAR